MEQTIVLSDYQNLIRKRAHVYSDLHGTEYEDLEAQGYLVFVEALEKFDPSKASFSTYLYHRLKLLGDYSKKFKKGNPASEVLNEEIAADLMRRIEEVVLFYDDVSQILSEDARRILNEIIYPKVGRKTSLQYCWRVLKEEANWSYVRTREAWREIGSWWTSFNLVSL